MDTRARLIQDDSEADLDEIQATRNTWDDREAIAVSKVTDTISVGTKSRVTGSQLTTMALDSATRVVAQLASGLVKPMTKDDKGTSILLDIMLHRYCVPNDNTPWNHLIKLRMLDFYSRIYGVMPMLYDYEIRKNYKGPISDIIPIRDWIPQRGRLTPKNSDYLHIDTWVSVQWLEAQAKYKGSSWDEKAIKKLIRKIENDENEATAPDDSRETSYVQTQRDMQSSIGTGRTQKIRLRTRYESGEDGHWITVAPKYDYIVLRDIPNPHDNGEIPVVLKHNIPLIDSPFGLSDFERGKPIQFAMDSVTNLTLDSIKMKLYPPMIVNPNGVIPSSLTYAPGKRWLETTPNSIRPYDVAPSSLNHFQAIHQFLSGLLQNQNGVNDTSLNAAAASDPGFGKTPEALKQLAQRTNTRDANNAFFMEQVIEDLYNGWISLIVSGQNAPIDLQLFGSEIEMLHDLGYEDINKSLKISGDRQFASITLDKSKFKGNKYQYYVDAGSTQRKDDQTQVESLVSLLGVVSKIPNLEQMLAQEGKKFSVGQIIQQIVNKSGVESPEKIIYRGDQTAPENQPQVPTVQPGTPMEADPFIQQAMSGQQAPQPPQQGAPNQVNQGARGAYQPQSLGSQVPTPQVNQVVQGL